MRTQTLLSTAALGMGFLIGGYTAASAALIPFTWNPSAVEVAGVPITTQGPFTADRWQLSDYATITIPASGISNPGAITEEGFLHFNNFQLGGGPSVGHVGEAGPGGWGLYEHFTVTAHGTGNALNLTGAFDTLNVDFYAYSTLNGTASFGFSNTTSHTPQITLPAGSTAVKIGTATGPVGPNHADITAGVPNASVSVQFVPLKSEAGFFVFPNWQVQLLMEQVFTNTTAQIKDYRNGSLTELPCKVNVKCVVTIVGGGGSGNVIKAIPEPATLSILGAGLMALGFIRRRRPEAA